MIFFFNFFCWLELHFHLNIKLYKKLKIFYFFDQKIFGFKILTQTLMSLEKIWITQENSGFNIWKTKALAQAFRKFSTSHILVQRQHIWFLTFQRYWKSEVKDNISSNEQWDPFTKNMKNTNIIQIKRKISQKNSSTSRWSAAFTIQSAFQIRYKTNNRKSNHKTFNFHWRFKSTQLL